MGVATFTDTLTSSVPAAKLFKVLFVDAPTHVPKAAPQSVRNIEIIQGSGGPGSILQFNFPEGAPVKFVKYKVDVLDKDHLRYVDTVLEGGELSDKIESVTYEVKFEATPNGGSVTDVIMKYLVKAGAELTEEEIRPAKEEGRAMFKAVETYILANPNV